MAGMMPPTGKMPGAKEVATLKGVKRDKDGVKRSPKTVEVPVAISTHPGVVSVANYSTPEELQMHRDQGRGYSEKGKGEEVEPGKFQHTGAGGLLSFNGQGGAGPGGDDAGDDTGGMGGDSEGEANDVSADNDGGETGEATDDVSSPGGSPLGGGGYGGPDGGGISETVGDVVGNSLGANGFGGTGYGFGGLGAVTGAITAAGEIAGEIGRDMGADVSTPTDAADDDPSTDRNEHNDPTAFGGGDQGNDVGPGFEETVAMRLARQGTTATQEAAQALQAEGRDGDTNLVHVNDAEVDALLAGGGRGTVNPRTGLLEFATEDTFDEELYLQNRPDVAEAITSGSWTGSALDHYNAHGRSEGTVANQEEVEARDEGFEDIFGGGRLNSWRAGRDSASLASQSISSTVTPDLPAPTTTGVSEQNSSTADNLASILNDDSPLMQRAAAQGQMAANRRGLLNSSIAAGASQAAMIDAALPVASQDAAQSHQSNLQQYEIQNQQWLAQLDATVRSEISVMQENTKREIANLQVADSDRARISAMVTSAQQLYSQEYATIINNPDIPAEDRDNHLTHIQNIHNNRIRVIEGMYGVDIDWSAAA